jgi:single-strand DNA-binding protein
MLNHITIMGRITKDIELRRTGSGVPVASFTLAVDRDFKEKNGEKITDFIDCVAWRNTAEFVEKYFGKGRMAVVSGSLQIRSWTDKDGNKRRVAEVIADNVYFADSKSDSNAKGAPAAAPAPNPYGAYGAPPASNPYGAYTPPASDFAMLEDDDAQLPF